MPRVRTESQTLTVGQLARRWTVSVQRVRSLVESGAIPGVFVIPAAGRYGNTLKIPLEVVLHLETQDWAVIHSATQARPKPRKKSGSGPALRHFQELATDQPGDESPGVVQD